LGLLVVARVLALTETQTGVVIGGAIGLLAGVLAAVVNGRYAATNAAKDRGHQVQLMRDRWLLDRWGETDVNLTTFMLRWTALGNALVAGQLGDLGQLKPPAFATDTAHLFELEARVRLYATDTIKDEVFEWLDARAAFWAEWGGIVASHGVGVDWTRVQASVQRLRDETNAVIATIRGEPEV
jgi:hypothetical protein